MISVYLLLDLNKEFEFGGNSSPVRGKLQSVPKKTPVLFEENAGPFRGKLLSVPDKIEA